MRVFSPSPTRSIVLLQRVSRRTWSARTFPGHRGGDHRRSRNSSRSEVVVEVRVLGQETDAATHIRVRRRTAEQSHAAAIAAQQPEHQLHRRRLAGAVHSQQAEDLTPAHVEIEAVDGDRPADSEMPAKGLGQPADLDRVFRRFTHVSDRHRSRTER